MKTRKICNSLALLLVAQAAFSHTVWADAPRLEEVIVTAQKRSQNVQDIPLTINVMEGDTLDHYAIRNSNDLANLVPGLVIQAAPHNLSNVTVRGLGTGAGSESYDQSVGLFIDGVYAGRVREFQAALFDLERVEIIKGTQNSLLGKNTSLGAISVVSRKPGQELGGYIQGDYEFEFDSVYGVGAVDLPTQFGNYRFAFNWIEEGAFVRNIATGHDVPQRDQATVRLAGSFNVGERGDLLLSYQYDDLEIVGDSFQADLDLNGLLIALDPGTPLGVDQVKSSFTSLGKEGEASDEQTSMRAYARYAHSFGDYTATSLTSWSSYDNQRSIDSDFLSVDYLNTFNDSDFSQFSQEFRLNSPNHGVFEYVVGLFYLNSEYDFTDTIDTAFPPPFSFGPVELTGASQKSFSQDTQVYSLFGQGTYSLTNKWRATVGARWTAEGKDVVFANSHLRASPGIGLISPLVLPTPLDRSEENIDGSVNLQYEMTEQSVLYASWAKGTKSGGFSAQVGLPEEAEFEAEVAKTYEVGAKLGLAGGSASVNVATFYTEIEDFQVVRFTGLGFETSSVPAESQGVEFEGQWLLSEQLMVSGSATYADAIQADTRQRLPQSPEWSALLALHYEKPLAIMSLTFQVDGSLSYVGEQYAHLEEGFLADSVTLLDIRASISSAQSQWELALVGKNLLDEEVIFGFDFPIFGGDDETSTIAGLNRPRTIALQGRYTF